MSKLYDLLSAMCGKIKKPDWNQNDPTAPDYVKNRPFWSEKVEQALEIQPEQFEQDGDIYACYDLPCEGFTIPIIGSKVKITFEGTELTLPCIVLNSGFHVGDNEDNFWFGESIYGFMLNAAVIDESLLLSVHMKSAPTSPFVISYTGEHIHKMESKFMPVCLTKYIYDEETGVETLEDVTGSVLVYSDFDPANNPNMLTINEHGELYAPGALGGNVKQWMMYTGSDSIMLVDCDTAAVGKTWTRDNVYVSTSLMEEGVNHYNQPVLKVWAANSNTGSSYVVPLTQYAKDHYNPDTVEWTGMFCTIDGMIFSVYVSRNSDGTAKITITKRM